MSVLRCLRSYSAQQVVGSYLAPLASVKVYASAPGAIISAGTSSATQAVETGSPQTLYAGARFAVIRGGSLVYFGGQTNTVSSASANQIVFDASITTVKGDYIINLGSGETGTASPNYDGLGTTISTTQDSGNAVSYATGDAYGNYSYFHDGTTDFWEIITNSSGTVVGIEPGITGGAMQGPTSATLNAVPRYSDANGHIVKDSAVIVDNSGNVSGVGTLAVGGAVSGVTSLTMAGALSGVTTLGMTGALSGATNITGTGTVQGATVTATGTANAVTLAVSGNATVTGTTGLTGALTEHANGTMTSAQGATWVRGVNEEEITIATSGTDTASTANLLPNNALIKAVTWRVTQNISGGTFANWSLGDTITTTRFCAAQTSHTLGDTGTAYDQWLGSIASDATGPTTQPNQALPSKLHITTNAAPTQGKIRVTVFYEQFTAATS